MFPLLEQTVASSLSLPSGFKSKIIFDEYTHGGSFRTIVVLDELNDIVSMYQACIVPDSCELINCELVNIVYFDNSVFDVIRSSRSVPSA